VSSWELVKEKGVTTEILQGILEGWKRGHKVPPDLQPQGQADCPTDGPGRAAGGLVQPMDHG